MEVPDQITFLIDNIDSLNVAERTKIAQILTLNDLPERLEKCANGVMINLDALPADIINIMYTTMLNIMSSRQ